MILTTRQLRVYVHREAVDMRKAYEGLSAIVRGSMHKEPMSGEVFVFVGKTRTRAKTLVWDGTGLTVSAKRLAKGRFSAPWQHKGEGPFELTLSELALLLDGSDRVLKTRLSPAEWTREEKPLKFD